MYEGAIYWCTASLVQLKSGLIRGVALGEEGLLIRGVAFCEEGLVRGLAFGEGGLVRGGWTIVHVQLTLVISNSMGPWKKFESTVVRLKRSYEDTGSVVCLTTKGRQLERNFEELKPASYVPILERF